MVLSFLLAGVGMVVVVAVNGEHCCCFVCRGFLRCYLFVVIRSNNNNKEKSVVIPDVPDTSELNVR